MLSLPSTLTSFPVATCRLLHLCPATMQAQSYILAISVSFPAALRAIRTRDAALAILNQQLAFLASMETHGFITGDEQELLSWSVQENRRILQSPFGLHKLLLAGSHSMEEVLGRLVFTNMLTEQQRQDLVFGPAVVKHYSQGECIQKEGAMGCVLSCAGGR